MSVFDRVPAAGVAVLEEWRGRDNVSRSSLRSRWWPSGLGIASETSRRWVRRSGVDAGARPGVTSEERAEIKRLSGRTQSYAGGMRSLKSAFFAAELDHVTPR